MELLNHVLALFLAFWGASLLFSIVATPIYIPTNSTQGSPLLHILVICKHWLKNISNKLNITAEHLAEVKAQGLRETKWKQSCLQVQ